MSEGNLLLRVDPERVGASGIRTVLDRCFDPTHRSLSSDSGWDECQWKQHAEETELIVVNYGEKAAVGSAVHSAIAADLLGDPVGIRVLVDRHLEEDHVKPFDVEKTYEKAERLFHLWEEEVKPGWLDIGVYAVEWELHLEIGGAMYHVHPDVVLQTGELRDIKTSEKRLEEFRARYDQQLTTYSYALWKVFDHLPPRVGFDGLIYANPPSDVKELYPTYKKPWYDRQDSTRTVEQFRSFEEGVARRDAARRFASATGVYQTQGTSGVWSCKGCEARAMCPACRGYEVPGQTGVQSAD